MMEKKPMLLAFLLHSLAVITFLSLSSCSSDPNQINCAVVPATTQPSEPVTCNDSALTGYDELVIITPHPDDEVLGFAGLMLEFIHLNKPVSIFVVTSGDAYCDACAFWKNVGILPIMEQWEQCDESELEEFAAIRKGETQSGQHVLGGPEPTFWAYPDTGIGTVWTAFSTGTGIDTKLRRSDCTKDGVFGKGSQIDATPRTLYNQLYSQQGFLSRTGTIPIGMGGLVDCNGYQMGFIRSNEMFLLEPH